MYCPECHHPLLGEPDTCPNCGHELIKKDAPTLPIETPKTEAPSHRAASQDALSTHVNSKNSESKIERKTLWGALCLFTPIAAFLLISIAMLLARNSTIAAGILGLFSGLFFLLSLVLIPAALLLSIFGLRTINRSGGAYSGKILAIVTTCLSSLIIVGGIASIVLFLVKVDFGELRERISEITDPASVVVLVQSGISGEEAKNRNDDTLNSFGTYYPETLDDAAPNSESDRNNPFFTKVMPPLGWALKGWKKGDDINTYILLSDSSRYIYDPQAGTFLKK